MVPLAVLLVAAVGPSCGGNSPTGPAPVMLSVEPDRSTVPAGATRQFIALVTGAVNRTATWSVDGAAGNGTIDRSGLYTAPAAVPDPVQVTVRATSQADTSVSGTALVTVLPAGPVTTGLVRVPAGSFTMGDGSATCGTSQDPVTLTEEFHLGQTEVTNAQYLEMVQWAYDHGYVTATSNSVKDAMGSTQLLLSLDSPHCQIAFSGGNFSLRDAGHGINPDHPVNEVTWYGAAAYCDWRSLREGLPQAYSHATWECNGGDPYRGAGYRLPTDAEWEYAAQYGDERVYPWGNEPWSAARANYGFEVGWTLAVGSYPAEKEIGGAPLYDMAGNVNEWCNDWWRCEAHPAPTDPPGPASGSYRVLRGGSWGSYHTRDLRCSYRGEFNPAHSYASLGFRIARTSSDPVSLSPSSRPGGRASLPGLRSAWAPPTPHP